ncbi:MAG: hypothetical protein HQK52_20050 [Oligoflexia bacterium]|nr:hypothetical protein [Oligoflexia bacterium]
MFQFHRQKKSLLTVTLLLLSSSLFAEEWNARNDPQKMSEVGAHWFTSLFTGKNLKSNFTDLPLAGKLDKDKMPWTDTYWPTYEGGIANRWSDNSLSDKEKIVKASDLKTSLADLKKMSRQEIESLSPAEKWDLYRGDYNYTLTKSEIERTRDVVDNPEGSEWFGLCHGWAPAALNFEEPGCTSVENKDGLVIKFFSSDIKALLTYYQGEACDPDAKRCFVGTRCEDTFDNKSFTTSGRPESENNDVNAGTFHIILANLIGKRSTGFIFDRTTDQPVWNQPVQGYSSKVLKQEKITAASAPAKRAAATVKEVTIESDVEWTGEIGAYTIPVNGVFENKMRHITKYQYILELNKDDEIIGGRWISANYPDFIWTREAGDMSKSPLFKELKKLYKKSLSDKN